MKIETKNNNPVAVGLLLCILAGTVTMTVRQLLPGDMPVAAAAVTPAAAAPAESAAETVRPIVWQGARSKRDPFYHPLLSVRIGARENPGSAKPPLPAPPPPPHFQQGLGVALVRPGVPVAAEPVTVRIAAPTPKPQKRVAAVPAPPQWSRNVARRTPAASLPVRDAEADLSARMRVTAIFGVSRRSAVIERAEADPLTVRVGDRVQMLRVVAVNEYDVVLAGAKGKWTLPLQTAPEGEAGEPLPQENADVPH